MSGKKKVLIMAANAGVSLSTGGATTFIFRLAERIHSLYGHEVYISGYHTLDPVKLKVKYAGILLSAYDHVHVVSGNLKENYFDIFKLIPFKLSAYNGLYFRGFKSWVEDMILKVKPDFLVFNDDIPISAEKFIRDIPTYLYIHFPLEARTVDITPPLKNERPLSEAINEFLIVKFLDSIIIRKPEEIVNSVIVNSTVTQKVMNKLGRGKEDKVLFPFWTVPDKIDNTKNVLLSIGTLHQEKRHELLIRALSNIPELKELRECYIVGYSRDRSYLKKLDSLVKRNHLERSVFIIPNAPDSKVLELLQRSLMTFQLGEFEPFGFSVLEGMSYGSIGVARKSDYSGAYLDILERGKYGSSFRNVDELSRLISNTDQEYINELKERSYKRTFSYTLDSFSDGILRMMPFD